MIVRVWPSSGNSSSSNSSCSTRYYSSSSSSCSYSSNSSCYFSNSSSWPRRACWGIRACRCSWQQHALQLCSSLWGCYQGCSLVWGPWEQQVGAGCRLGQCFLLVQAQACQQPGCQRRAVEEGLFRPLQHQQQHRRQHLQPLVQQQGQLQQGLGPVSSSSRLQHSPNRGGGSGMAGTPCFLASGQRRRSRPWRHNRVVAAAAAAQQRPQAHPETSGVLHRAEAVSNSAAAASLCFCRHCKAGLPCSLAGMHPMVVLNTFCECVFQWVQVPVK
jgi:hypothetical protein